MTFTDIVSDILHFNFANIFTGLGVSRDSVLFFWGKFVGVVAFLAAMGADQAHMTYGIPTSWMHVIMVLAAWLAYFSAQNSTSKLFGAGAAPGHEVTPDAPKS